MDREIAEWRSIGAAPVRSDAPGGDSVRYDPDFELLEAQLQKLESLTREPVDWHEVVALGSEIIRKKSKDLLVSGYLALGLVETEGFAGLSKALACLEGMASELWPFLYPETKRSRARINALRWLAEKAGSAVSQKEPKPTDAEAVLVCEAQVKSLQSLLEEKIGPDAPDLTDLLRPLQEVSKSLSSGASASKPVVETQPATAQVGTPFGGAATMETLEDSRRVLKEAASAARRAVSFIRGKDPAGAAAYRLIRSLIWYEIDELPPTTDGRSRLPPPPIHLRDRLHSLAGQSAWSELLHEVEARVAEFPFWLDLHRMSFQALAGLGPDHAHARDAVVAGVAQILNRLPGLSALEFSDGTPFADEATRKWISAELFPAAEERPMQAETPEQRDDALTELSRESRRLLREGKQEEAMTFVQQAMRTAPEERQRFLIRLELARLCLDAHQVRSALAHLEVLDEQILRYSLEAWEPELSMEVLRVYWDALNQSARESRQASPETPGRAEAIYSRLCKLDVMAGLRLTPGKDRASIGRLVRS